MSVKKSKMDDAAKALFTDPTPEKWRSFEGAAKGIAAHYRVRYMSGRIRSKEDLGKSFVEIYDSRKRLLAKVPLFERKGGMMRGGLIHLKGLTSLR